MEKAKKSPQLQAEEKGHTVVFDPPYSSGAERWTCQVCGAAAILNAGNLYGSAVRKRCPGK